LYEEAVAFCRGEDDALQLAHTVRHLGDIHQDMGHIDLAEPLYREALKLYGGLGQTPRLELANAIRPLAILKERAGEVEEAIHLWRQARDLYAAVNVQAGVAESSAHISDLGG
jgi:tetratricopeptide (TPR) repeat protein